MNGFKEKGKAAGQKVKDFFKKMSKGTKMLLVGAIMVLALVIAAAVMMVQNKPYQPLLQNLSTAESSSVMEYLQNIGVQDYRLDGSTLYVRSDQRDQIITQLAMAGYPKEASYSFYTQQTGITATNSERREAMRIATQEELAKAIRAFNGVQDATVFIAFGEDNSYILDFSAMTNTTATVELALQSGFVLPDETADAIRRIVNHAVQGLKFENVFITDTNGGHYDGSSTASITDSSALKYQMEQRYSNQIRANVLHLLESIYGPGNVKTSVTVVVDVDEKIVESTEYSQPEGSTNHGGLIGHEEYYWQVGPDGAIVDGGIVGTPSNSEIPMYPTDAEQYVGNENIGAGGGQTDQYIDTTHTQKKVIACTITDITIGVTINAKAQNAMSVTDADLRNHVAVTAGIGGEEPENRVSVLIAPFAEDVPAPTTPGFIDWENLPDWAIYAALGALLLLIILFLLLSLLFGGKKKKKDEKAGEEDEDKKGKKKDKKKKRKRKKGEPEEPEEEPLIIAAAEAIAAGEKGADIMEMNTEKSMELRKSVRQFAQNNPEIAAQIIKTWLKGDDDNG